MDLGSKHKPDPNFNMSSMTDMIFLLLVFFMLTSNFVTPSGLKINLPTSRASGKVMPKINVGLTKDLHYYINEVKIPYNLLEDELADALKMSPDKTVVLSIDETVPTKYTIDLGGLCTKLGAKTVVSVKPN